ncbi:MAG: FAD-dependent oxidoreductase [Thermodesulfobacteriota bacterium]
MSEQDQDKIRMETDVLILGAGAAGCAAAIAAREQGAKTILVDKGALVSCGSTGGGQDHFGAHLNSGPEWDSDETATKWYSLPGWGASGWLVEKSFTREVGSMIKRMEEWGVRFFKNPDGTYWRCQALGQPGPWWLMMENGRYLKRILAAKVRECGAEVVEQAMIVKLFSDKGRVTGAFGYDRRKGTFYAFKAKTVVLAMGAHQSRWFTNSTRNPFNIWQNPSNTGTQLVVAYDAGAKVKNLEWCVSTTLPKGYGAPAMCAFGGMGATMINALGEPFMGKYHPLGEKAPRAFHIKAERQEIAEGKGPLFVDARHLAEKDMNHLCANLLSVDKHTFGDYLEQRGIDLKKQPLEVELGEFSGGGNLHVNENLESVNLKGLFGLPFSGMLSTALCGGFVAGREAAKAISQADAVRKIDDSVIEREKVRVMAQLKRDEGYLPDEFENMIRQVMMQYMGYQRNRAGLEIATQKLRMLGERIEDVRARNLHELTRAHEALHLLKYCQLMVRSVMERRGMRGFYVVTDYPPTMDPELRSKYVVLAKENGETKVTFEPMD